MKHYFQLLFFSYSAHVTMTPGFNKKVQKSFAAYHYPHLTVTTWQDDE